MRSDIKQSLFPLLQLFSICQAASIRCHILHDNSTIQEFQNQHIILEDTRFYIKTISTSRLSTGKLRRTYRGARARSRLVRPESGVYDSSTRHTLFSHQPSLKVPLKEDRKP